MIPYGKQLLDEQDIDAVIDVLKSNTLTTGPYVERFENKLSEITKAKYSIVVSSGTAALHLALLALNIKPGSEVIVPAISFVASANAVLYAGCDVIFADVNPKTGLLGSKELSEALLRCKNAAAVMPVHFAGQACNMKEIYDVAKTSGLRIIEDASHAIGTNEISSLSNSIGACSYSDVCTFSFHPVKTITMGEGGAITTNDSDIAKSVSLLRNHGLTRDRADFLDETQCCDESGRPFLWYYEMQHLGFNYRASDIHCALGYSQLCKLKDFISKRKSLCDYYDKALEALSPVIRPLEKVSWSDTARHLYIILVDFKSVTITRDVFMRKLQEEGVGSQVHYIPIYRQPFYKNKYSYNYSQYLPGAESFYSSALSIPLFPSMEFNDIDFIVNKIRKILRL